MNSLTSWWCIKCSGKLRMLGSRERFPFRFPFAKGTLVDDLEVM